VLQAIRVASPNAAQRLKRNILRLLDEHSAGTTKRTRVGLAKALGVKPNGISTILGAPDVPHFKLRDLDRIAEYFGIPPAALIAEDGNVLWELRPSEMRLMRIWRQWPLDVQDATLFLLNYFAALEPAEKSIRRLLSKFRRLSKNDQDYVERTIDSLRRHTGGPDKGAGGAPSGQ
jgi:hypothetical protein